MHYTYVLLSSKDWLLYAGTTCDLPRRINEHREGQVRYLRNRLAGFLTEIRTDKLERR